MGSGKAQSNYKIQTWLLKALWLQAESGIATSIKELLTVYGKGDSLPKCLAHSKQELQKLGEGKELQAWAGE